MHSFLFLNLHGSLPNGVVARRRSRRDGGGRGWLFAYFLATERRSARRAENRPLKANQACCQYRDFKPNKPPAQS